MQLGLCGKATEDSARWRVEKHATVSAQREDTDLVSVTNSPAAVSAVHAAVRRLRPAQGRLRRVSCGETCLSRQ